MKFDLSNVKTGMLNTNQFIKGIPQNRKLLKIKHCF